MRDRPGAFPYKHASTCIFYQQFFYIMNRKNVILLITIYNYFHGEQKIYNYVPLLGEAFHKKICIKFSTVRNIIMHLKKKGCKCSFIVYLNIRILHLINLLKFNHLENSYLHKWYLVINRVFIK